jgi:hypothetical protein
MCEVFEDEASIFETQRSAHNTLVASGPLNSAGSSCRDKLRFQRRIIQLSFGSWTA